MKMPSKCLQTDHLFSLGFKCVTICLENLFSLQWPHMRAMASQSPANSDYQQRKYQSSTLLTLCEENPPWLVDSSHKGPVMWTAFSWHDIIMQEADWVLTSRYGIWTAHSCWPQSCFPAASKDLLHSHVNWARTPLRLARYGHRSTWR